MDRILERFLRQQFDEGMALAAPSDIFDLVPLGGPIPNRYIVQFHCRGLVRQDDQIVEADRFDVGVWFGDNYLRATSTFDALTWLGPANAFHPNIDPARQLICIGRLVPATPLVDVIYQLHEVITYAKFNTADPLVRDACAWVRRHQTRFPIDERPLRRRALNLDLEEIA